MNAKSWTKVILAALVVVAIALGAAYRTNLAAWFGWGMAQAQTEKQVGHDTTQGGEPKVLYWYDPMHPWNKSDKPGIAIDCGMKLVPKYADEAEPTSAEAPAGGPMGEMQAGAIQLSPAKQQLIGVRTGTVAAEDLSQIIRAVGLVEIDETRKTHVHTKVSGWVRKVLVDYTWQHVEKGAPLFTLYSPELVSAQQEYLIARRAQSYLGASPYAEASQGSEALLRAARRRLQLWDVTDEQIAELEQRGTAQEEITFYSPVTGHVVERNLFPNQYITAESVTYTVVDHSRVWVQVQLYEYESAGVRVGLPAAMTVQAYPGRVFPGQVAFVQPHVEMMTRTLPVRLEFENPELVLKPGMFATAELRVGLGRQMVVPRDAVLDTGARQIVFLAREGGYFEPREILVGARLGDRIVVLKGLAPGDTIATSAVFLLDSESRLKSAMPGMQPSDAATEGSRGAPGAVTAQIEFTTTPSPPRFGTNELGVRLRNASGKPVTDAEVRVTFLMPAMPTMGMGAMQQQATLAHTGNGEYHGQLELPMSGTWQVTVTARRQGQVLASKQFSVVAE
ncbi:MAG: FixH family protein [Candidatus Acidiferrales bacterium]